jgi:iron complex outermembrane receptor protein
LRLPLLAACIAAALPPSAHAAAAADSAVDRATITAPDREAPSADALAQRPAVGVLETIVVTADRERSFGADLVQAGTFRNARVLDTPLTVNVVTRDVLDAQAAQGLYDALRNTGGVTRSQLNGATYDNVAIRGILVENRGNYRLNGSLPVINLVEQPLEDKARVEVLKGVSALYYGFAPPSGIINFTTKRAGTEPLLALALKGDEHGSLQGHVDASTRFGAGERFGVRVNVAGGRVDTGVRGVDGDRALGAVALDWDVNERLGLKLDVEHVRKDIAEPAAIALLPARNGAIPLPALPDPATNYAGDWQRYDADATNVLARADLKLSRQWALTVEAGRAETARDRAYSQLQNYDLASGAGTLRMFLTRNQRYRNDNVRTELAGAFRSGPLEHEITIGWTRNERWQRGTGSQIVDVAQNLYAPVEITPRAITAVLAVNPSTITDRGAYLFDRMQFGERWQLLGGLRYSDYESTTRTTRYVAHEASPSLAIVYKPLPRLSVYGTYLEGLEEGGTAPANAVNAFEVLPPAVSTQYEVGVKAEALQGIVLSLAAFQIDRPSSYTNSEGRFVLDGETRYRGAELAASGEITADWSLVASALWLDAEQTKAASAALIGKRPENTARWTGSVFLEWRSPRVVGLALNAGVFHTGKRAVNPLNQAFVDGYTTGTVGARYGWKFGRADVTAQLNVDNVTNEKYWNSTGNGLLGVSLPRTTRLTVTTKF